MNDFLTQGKNVNEIPRGISSHDGADKSLRPDTWQIDNTKGERTYLPEVVDSLEKRRQSRPNKPEVKRKKPRKKLIYDDFGEPLRWVWVDE